VRSISIFSRLVQRRVGLLVEALDSVAAAKNHRRQQFAAIFVAAEAAEEVLGLVQRPSTELIACIGRLRIWRSARHCRFSEAGRFRSAQRILYRDLIVAMILSTLRSVARIRSCMSGAALRIGCQFGNAVGAERWRVDRAAGKGDGGDAVRPWNSSPTWVSLRTGMPRSW